MKYLLIDIRKSDEVYSHRFSVSNHYKVYTIPMNMIRFNRDMILKHLDYVDEIYIVCKTGYRSRFIKNKYFSNYHNIKVSKDLQFAKLNIGRNRIQFSKDKFLNVSTVGSNTFNLYSITRIIQLMLGLLIVLLGGYTYFMNSQHQTYSKVPLIILLVFGVMAVINGLTSTCTISSIFMNVLN